MLQKCELRQSSSFIRLEKLVKMKLLNGTASGMSSVISDDEQVKKSAADEVVVEDVSESPTEMDLDEPELNLKLSEDEEEEEDDGDDTDIDDDLLNSFTSVLTTPESPVKRLVIGKLLKIFKLIYFKTRDSHILTNLKFVIHAN